MRPAFLSSVLACTLSAVLSITGCGRNKGDKVPDEDPQAVAPKPADKASPCMTAGAEVYDKYCLVCHQAGGGGVRGLNPPLKDTEYVLGSPERLISILLQGSNVGLEVKGTTYANAMPGFSYLTDEEIACVATYIRNSFGNTAGAISPEEVGKARVP